MALLPQSPQAPAGLTVGELVALGRYPHQKGFGRLTDDDKRIIDWALSITHLGDFAARPIDALSGGQRQRAWIAMALAQDTGLILLDEPTTYLDIGQKYEMLELIAQVNAMGKTVVMVLHDLPLAFSYSHQVVVLEKGRLAALGPADQVFASGVPARVFGVKSQALEVDGRQEYFFYQA